MSMRCILIILLLASGWPIQSAQWYRGNTHTHTAVQGNTESRPQNVANWYYANGYNFLVITDINRLTDPGTIDLPADSPGNFILIPGEEVADRFLIHSTALNISNAVPRRAPQQRKSSILQNQVDAITRAGGHAILNHPNYQYAVTAADILPVDNLHFFELYNTHPAVNNPGDRLHPSTEQLWDELLSNGSQIYGVASDDAHQYRVFSKNRSNPGRGWIMVRAASLAAGALVDAMLQGDFYASTGIFLQEYQRGPEHYRITVDLEKTSAAVAQAVNREVIIPAQRIAIQFIGEEGSVLQTIDDIKAAYPLSSAANSRYVRARVSYTLKQPDGNETTFHAWGQPVFREK